MSAKYIYWLAVIMIIILLFFLSSVPNLVFFQDNLPPIILKLVNQYSFRFGGTGFFSYSVSLHPDYLVHKAGHIILYGLLGSVLYKALGGSFVWANFLVALFAASDELHQAFVPGRSCRLGDVVLNILAATVFIYAAYRKESKLNSRAFFLSKS